MSAMQDLDGEPPSFFVRALYDFESSDASSLSFRKGAVIEVLTQLESGWWDGLMENDVRGWFPSNYVEPISDEEAEMELAAQAHVQNQLAAASASPTTSTTGAFAGLGIGGGFDSLQALIKGEGLGASDAFGQLAEAAMLDPRRGMFGLGEVIDDPSSQPDRRVARNGGAAPPLHANVRNSFISASSLNSADASSRFESAVQSDGTSPQTRSQSNSVTEADRYKDRSVSVSGTNGGMTSAIDRERLRAMSLSTPDQRLGVYPASSSSAIASFGRPRAATGLEAAHPDLAAGSASYSSMQRYQNQRQYGDSSEQWIPRVTDRGEIVYYNTRTQAVSRDVPAGVELSLSGTPRSSTRSSLDDHDSLRPGSAAMMRPSGSRQGSSSNSISKCSVPTSSMSSRPSSGNAASNSRPSSVNSNNTAVLIGSNSRSSRPPTRNAVENMPDPRDVPPPWRLRLTDDERHFFYCHKFTRETRYDLPPETEKRPVGSRASSSISLHDEAGASRRSLSFSGAGGSDDSDLDGAISSKLPGKSPRERMRGSASTKDKDQYGLAALSSHPLLNANQALPSSLADDARAAVETQRHVGPGQPMQISLLVRRAHEAIRLMAAIACEQIGTDGLSEVDRSAPTVSDDGVYLPRLAATAAAVVAAIRDVLYAAGSLSLLAGDTAAISQLLHLQIDPTKAGEHAASAGSSSAAFADIIRALQGKSPADDKLLKLSGASAAEQTASIPAPMYPLGRKINATISKLVLSARQVIDHTVTLSSSPTSKKESTMTELDAETFEKIYQCRQRLREDALELNRLLQSFGDEAERARATALMTSNGKGWLRRIEAGLESDLGLAGVGATTLGGGMGAGWQGSGFVLPTAYEVAALRSEVQGGFANPFEVRKDVQSSIIRGRATLTRKPTVPLALSVLPPLQAQVDALQTVLAALRTDLIAGSSSEQTTSLAAHLDAAMRRSGSLLALLEDVDVASSIDVDGMPANEAKGSAINERIASRAAEARSMVQRFGLLRQATYDASSKLLLAMQDVSSPVHGAEAVTAQRTDLALRTANTLSRLSSALLATLKKLSEIAEEQLKDASPNIGARASVYEIEEDRSAFRSPTASSFSRQSMVASISASADIDPPLSAGGRSLSSSLAPGVGQDEGGGSETEVMYLGPGIAVPNGPRARNRSVASNAPSTSSNYGMTPSGTSSSGHMSIAPASRGSALGSIVNRQRSTSVTTGGSSLSMQSLQETTRSLLSRRGTLADSHQPASIDESDESRQAGQKVRRLLGDDVSLSAHTTHESESGSVTSSMKRREEDVPWFLEPDYDPRDILFGADGQVKGATLGALLARVTMHNAFDTSFNNTFLMTYRSFTTTEELLELLFMRFRIEPAEGLTEEELAMWVEKKQKPIRLRVFNLLKSWLEGHFYEGEDDRYLDRVRRFAVEEMSQAPSMKAPSQQLVRLVERRQGEGEQMIRKMVLPTSAPPPILPKNLKRLKLLEIDALEMARQLTLIESRLYNQVKPAECLGLKWTKPGNEIHAKGIMDSINTHNKISAWVADAILEQEDLKKRSTFIKQFIAIADRCRSLNNFSGMWAIVSALSTAPIHRLRRTWDAVSQKHVIIFESLETLMSASRNWANYREMIHKLNPPCVPFLGRYLGDLTFIEDGNRDRLKDDSRLINFGKRQKTAEVIREITIHQSTPYNLTPVPAIQKFIDERLVESRTADELYEQSLRLEPREREDEKIARLLQESGFL